MWSELLLFLLLVAYVVAVDFVIKLHKRTSRKHTKTTPCKGVKTADTSGDDSQSRPL
ncbi:hypothetical protein GCM10010965_25650 [Caldalkalibacillus thermarum]|uniref:hypothetical protein n=1 Tax=Caldalkalibacillus thermarum TaxID=296745 RepID=UPI00166F24BC|nr:hypothetical protein [Caldalkalibacillus thermarum]GGK31684.1 hypothetical protein GCM10010965_25650 [Caldalkalibacillus thermarum]